MLLHITTSFARTSCSADCSLYERCDSCGCTESATDVYGARLLQAGTPRVSWSERLRLTTVRQVTPVGLLGNVIITVC